MAFLGMDPRTVKDVADALKQANGAAATALATLRAVRTRHDAAVGERADRLRESLEPAIRRTDASVRTAGVLTGQLLAQIGEQQQASGARPGIRVFTAGIAPSPTPGQPNPLPIQPPRVPGQHPPAPRPPLPGQIRIPGGPTIPSDIVTNGPRPVLPVPELPVPEPVGLPIPWRLLGRLGGLTTALSVLLIPDNTMPMFDYVDPLGHQHRLNEDQMSAVHHRLPGYEQVLGYPEGTVLPHEAPGVTGGRPIEVPDPTAEPLIAPGDGTLGPVVEPQQPIAPIDAPPDQPGNPLEAAWHPPPERVLPPEIRGPIEEKLRDGVPLSPDDKQQLWAEARHLWRTNPAAADVPTGIGIRKGEWSVHHIVPLEWAHLFPGLYPNDPGNLVLIQEPLHSELHRIFREEMVTSTGELVNRGIDAERAREVVIRAFGAEFGPTRQGAFYRLRTR